jgi:hypothetical protein
MSCTALETFTQCEFFLLLSPHHLTAVPSIHLAAGNGLMNASTLPTISSTALAKASAAQIYLTVFQWDVMPVHVSVSSTELILKCPC